MGDDIGLFEAIHSQRSIRWYKPDPVPDELIRKVLDAGIRAPSGANSQRWRFIVIRDPDLRKKVGDLARKLGLVAPEGLNRWQQRMWRGAVHLANHLEEVPVLILVCDQPDPSPTGSSIFPAIQNMLLAARGLGLGSVLTTGTAKGFAKEIKELPGMPEGVETVALLPLGYPAEGVRYGPNRRLPVEEVTFFDRWGTPPDWPHP